MRLLILNLIFLTFLLPFRAFCDNKAPFSRKLPDAADRILESPDRVEVYSLTGEHQKGGWKNFEVLGKTWLENSKEVGKLVSAIKGGIADNAARARCPFAPHHGIHAAKGDQTLDLVLCFRCSKVLVYLNGKPPEDQVFAISRIPEAILDSILSKAQIPLAPKPNFLNK